ncbi:MAG: DUF3999 domain-containing protein [Proteobacteria bacterium]|nr:DUF3999 domain-containing protein [Pseudomonadota bacterium]
MTRTAFAGLVALLLAPCAQATPDTDYAYAWPLQTTGDGAAWQVELAPEVYAAIGTEDLRDVEVVNADGASVPTAIYHRVRQISQGETWIDLPLFVVPVSTSPGADGDESIRLHIERGADGKLRQLDAHIGAPVAAAPATPTASEWLLDASSVRETLEALRIDWSADNADTTAQFSIGASEDLQHWRVLVAEATVMELRQAGNLLQRHDVALHGARANYLRLRRLDAGAPLPAMRVRLRALAMPTVQQPVRQWLATQVVGSAAQRLDPSLPAYAGDHLIAFDYQLPAALVASGLRVELADENSVVAAHVLSRRVDANETKAPWALRAGFVAFRIRQGATLVENDEVPVSPGGRARDWRIELATPLEHAPRLEVAYIPDRFVFLAQGAGPYRLVAGSARVRRADYPVDTALASLRSQLGNTWQPPLATLGARQVLQGSQAMVARTPTPARNWKTWLLWTVLVGAAILIGGMAWSLVRKP